MLSTIRLYTPPKKANQKISSRIHIHSLLWNRRKKTKRSARDNSLAPRELWVRKAHRSFRQQLFAACISPGYDSCTMKTRKTFSACVSDSVRLLLKPLLRKRSSVYPDAHALSLICIENPDSHRTKSIPPRSSPSALRSVGYEVTEHVGGTGIVAIMKNGSGPTVMLRTELDAFP